MSTGTVVGQIDGVDTGCPPEDCCWLPMAVRDGNLGFHGIPCGFASVASDIDVPFGADVAIPVNNVVSDDLGAFANGIFTAPCKGKYLTILRIQGYLVNPGIVQEIRMGWMRAGNPVFPIADGTFLNRIELERASPPFCLDQGETIELYAMNFDFTAGYTPLNTSDIVIEGGNISYVYLGCDCD